jgi:DNA-binding CsgD family transcriptional regulator
MVAKALLQALSEPEFRASMAMGAVEAWGDLRGLEVFALLAAMIGRQGPKDAPPSSAVAATGSQGADLASKLVGGFIRDLRGVVGAGSGDGVLLLDRDGVVQGANRAARDLADTGFFVLGEKMPLTLADRLQQKAYRSAFTRFCAEWPDEMRGLLDKQTILVLRPAFDEFSVLKLIAATFRKVRLDVAVPIERLQSIFGLSLKQAEMAQAVMRGLGPVEFAQEHGCSKKTARFHLYGLMRKIGARTRYDLVNCLTRTFG